MLRKVFFSTLMVICLLLAAVLVVSLGMGLPFGPGLTGVVLVILCGFWAACMVDREG